jgi:hypothetical protein
MPAVHYDTYSDARKNFKEVPDAAQTGRPVTVRRESLQVAVLDANRLRHFLAACVPSTAPVFHEGTAGPRSSQDCQPLPMAPLVITGGKLGQIAEPRVH